MPSFCLNHVLTIILLTEFPTTTIYYQVLTKVSNVYCLMSEYTVFKNWVLKACLNNVQQTSIECPIVWFPGGPTTRYHRRPEYVPIYNLWIFAPPVKTKNTYVIQGQLPLSFIIKSPIFVLAPWDSPECPL